MTKVECVCLNCGKNFKVKPSIKKKNGGIFCTFNCYNESRKKIKKICLNCKKEFFVIQSEIKKGRGNYCSKKCYWKSLIGKKWTKRQKEKLSDRNLGIKNPFYGKKHTEETKIKISQSHKNRVVSEETRKKLSIGRKNKHHSEKTRKKLSEIRKGSLNPMWKGGYFPQKYCFKFNKALKDEIRKEHNYKCFLCSTIQKFPGLCIHHIDYNCNAGCNNKKFYLVPLCLKCHVLTNYNRGYWFNLLINYWSMNTEINFNYKDGDFYWKFSPSGKRNENVWD